jgi:hypothetical protein
MTTEPPAFHLDPNRELIREPEQMIVFAWKD